MQWLPITALLLITAACTEGTGYRYKHRYMYHGSIWGKLMCRIGLCKAMCRAENDTCGNNQQCCGDGICQMGTCKTPEPGTEGSGCQSDADCNKTLCCAKRHQKGYYYSSSHVCTKLRTAGQVCYPIEDNCTVHYQCPCAQELTCSTNRTTRYYRSYYGYKQMKVITKSRCMEVMPKTTDPPTTEAVTRDTNTITISPAEVSGEPEEPIELEQEPAQGNGDEQEKRKVDGKKKEKKEKKPKGKKEKKEKKPKPEKGRRG
ncbi:uncharacterized protein LOC134193191 isoform X2 [Corticium candelabrum]|uniref:uncharacterized protein LOC134193191 isoform X2 n=1 Tax=Corticium candelabrum TaxID=121492 RepID=UPI002E25EC92|nr:uncharacterized protein LOC134193191 isoform X2 [Corticium candelabrum]